MDQRNGVLKCGRLVSISADEDTARNRVRNVMLPLASIASAIMVAACGGGGGGSSNASPGNPAPTSVTISGVIADGPLQGATACYDLNDNGVCDPGEPTSSASDAKGSFGLDVAVADAGKHRIIVNVPAGAIDQDTGQPVGQAYTLQAPASGNSAAQTAFVSPLTTLVQLRMDSAHETLADATAGVQSQAGLATSPLADYTADSSVSGKAAAALARVVISVQQQLSTTLAANVVGKTDLSGATVTSADLESAIRRELLQQLPTLAAAAGDTSVVTATDPAARIAAIAAVAQSVANALAPTAAQVLQDIGIAKLPPETAAANATPQDGASLRMLTFTDRDHWFYRAHEMSAADDTPDASGHHRYYDVRSQATIDIYGLRHVDAWGSGVTLDRRGDLHWNGTAWVDCELGQRSWNTGRDATGFTRYDYCDGYQTGYSVRTPLAIAGKTIRSVIGTTVRTFAGSEAGFAYSTFGPVNLDLLGSATFPANSVLYAYTDTPQDTAVAYDVTNVVGAFSADAAAGGDARTGNPPCATANVVTAVTSLEDMIARSPGKPCIKGQITNSDGTSLNPTARWATTSRGIGSAAGAATQPPGTGNYYTTTALYRVAFDGTGTGVRYYSCLQRNADGAATDCTVIGTGNYRIDTLGDARVMRLLGLPAITQRTGSEPAFVERGGLVYPGYRNLQTVHQFLAFNLDAANALLTQLGLQPLAPIPPASAADAARAALFATIKGAWTIFDGNNAIVFRFGDDGTYLMAQSSADPTSAEQPGLERGFIDIDPATHNYRTLIATDTNWESGLSNPGPGEGTIPTITPTQISGPGFSFNRLPNDPNGIVGMWAQATSGLNTKHVVVFPNGRVLFIDPVGETTPPDVDDPCIDANAGPPGIEWASYTFDPTTGALQVFGKQIDTNGCSGIFDSSPGAPPNATQSFVLTFSADKSSFTNERGYTFYRVAP